MQHRNDPPSLSGPLREARPPVQILDTLFFQDVQTTPMPLPFAPLVGFLVGIALALAAASEVARDDGPMVMSRPFGLTVAFAMLIHTPVVGYFVAFHGDWAYLYVVPWHRVPSALDLTFVLLGAAATVAGQSAAYPFVRKRRLGALVGLAAGPLALLVALATLFSRQLGTSANFAQFHGGFGVEPIAASTLGRGVLWMACVYAAGLAWCVRAMWRLESDRDVRERGL